MGIAVHPKDPNTIWTMSEGYFKSTDGGKTWRSERTPHGDNHDLWINPNSPDIMVQSNDGGANVTLNGGRTWSTIYNQPTAEIYQIYTDNQFPYRIYGAQQDNSTLIMPSFPLSSGTPDRSDAGVEGGAGVRDRTDLPASDESRHRLRLVQGAVLAHAHVERTGTAVLGRRAIAVWQSRERPDLSLSACVADGGVAA